MATCAMNELEARKEKMYCMETRIPHYMDNWYRTRLDNYKLRGECDKS